MLVNFIKVACFHRFFFSVFLLEHWQASAESKVSGNTDSLPALERELSFEMISWHYGKKTIQRILYSLR